MLFSRTLLFIHPIYNSLHLLIPNAQSFLPPTPPTSPWQPQVCSLYVSVTFKSMALSFFLLSSNNTSTITPEKELIYCRFNYLVVVQSPSHVQIFATPSTASCQASLSFTISQNLPKFMFIASVMRSGHLILWCPLLLLPSIFPSIRDFFIKFSVHIRWPKDWSFSFSISSSIEYSGLISLKIDWFDLLAVQGTFKSLFQHHRSMASILRCSAFLIVQLSHPYMTTGKNIALTIWTFVSAF